MLSLMSVGYLLAQFPKVLGLKLGCTLASPVPPSPIRISLVWGYGLGIGFL